MIADSPYRANEPVLTPGKGAWGGIAASVLMLFTILLLERVSGLSVSDLLTRIARTMLPRGVTVESGPTLIAGATICLLLGAVLGLLYAVSQERAPARSLIAVGIVYGFLIWLASRVVTSWLFGPVFRTAFRSYGWFAACLVYGVVLAGYAVWVDRHRPRVSASAVPID